jgi:hypothetical protein
MLVGINPSLFQWEVKSILLEHRFTSNEEAGFAKDLLSREYGLAGLNEKFHTVVQGTVTVIGCAGKRMRRAYSSLGMKSADDTLGGPIGSIDCNVGGDSNCCSEAAACIRHVRTKTGEFQISALSSTDLVLVNGQRIAPEMGGLPLFNDDIVVVGPRVFIFVLPVLSAETD